ncbi:MAG TPA: ABC transporter ATP-binding protein [Mogibacterium sp.]|nr:ABC transporter ATP-binding protein [Mogibacterium sp.]
MSEIPIIIRFKDVSKSYGETLVFEHVNVDISKGEFITLIGKSGCGKTTFLKLVNALILADEGEVNVFGNNIKEVNHINLRRKIGYVIQGVGLFPHMTVRKNIGYVPSLFRHPPSNIYPMNKLLDMVSLDEELLDRYPRELSGGQRQRVGIARALITMPSIMLMDEPFGAVDEITRKQLQESIARIHKELGITILFVTHSVEEAFLLGTRVAIFDNHNIVQIDEPKAIIEKPANDFVKELIGKVGVLEI